MEYYNNKYFILTDSLSQKMTFQIGRELRVMGYFHST